MTQLDRRPPTTRLLTGALVLGTAAAFTVAGIAPAHASGPACTDSWKTGTGGSWDTGSNWSKGAAPTATDVACITAAGSYTVVIGNETIKIAGLTLGGSGSTPTLQIGNGGSGFASFTSTGTMTVAGTFSIGFGASLSAPEIDNNGTFLVPASSYASTMSVTKFLNAGAFSDQAVMTYTLPTSASLFSNTGSLTVASNATLAVGSPSGQTASIVQNGLITDNGLLTLAGAVEISGGSICGGTPYVGSGDGGAGGSLSFDASVGAGPSCGSGVTTDSLFIPNVTATVAGTIPAAYTVTSGDGGSSFPHITLSGVTNAGHLTLGFGGDITGGLINSGTFTVPASSYATTWTSSGIANTGVFAVNAVLSITLANGATFSNPASATVSTAVDASLAIGSASGNSASFVQAGTITNLGSLSIAEALQINGGSLCGNPVYSGSGDGGQGGSLTFAAKPAKGAACAKHQTKDSIFIPNVTGTIGSDIPKGWTVTIGDGGSSFAHVTMTGDTNSGVLNVGYGATLTDAATLVNTGTVTVPKNGYSTVFDLAGYSDQGKTSVLGTTTFTLHGGSFAIAAKKSLTVGVNVPFATDGALTNAGTLTVDTGGTVQAASLSQATTGTFVAQVGDTSESTYLTLSGAAHLAGTLSVIAAKKFHPPSGQQITLVSAGSVSGTFATVKGTFTPHYTSTTVTATNA